MKSLLRVVLVIGLLFAPPAALAAVFMLVGEFLAAPRVAWMTNWAESLTEPATPMLARRRIDVRGGHAIIPVRCDSAAGCRGSISFRRGRARMFESSGVEARRLRVPLSAAMRRTFRRGRMRAVLRISGPNGNRNRRVVLMRRR